MLIEVAMLTRPLVRGRQAQRWHEAVRRECMDRPNRARFRLPARCAGCGAITPLPHQFCASCWQQVDWLGQSGCESCGIPLEATDVEHCGRCLAEAPIIARTRAAVAYGDIARSLVLRLKYSRKVALAATMARYMRGLVDSSPDTIVVPVPLHWSRMCGSGSTRPG